MDAVYSAVYKIAWSMPPGNLPLCMKPHFYSRIYVFYMFHILFNIFSDDFGFPFQEFLFWDRQEFANAEEIRSGIGYWTWAASSISWPTSLAFNEPSKFLFEIRAGLEGKIRG